MIAIGDPDVKASPWEPASRTPSGQSAVMGLIELKNGELISGGLDGSL